MTQNRPSQRTFTLGAAAALLLAGADLAAQAREIEIDEATITAGTREGRSTAVPWSGVWWPFTDLELSRGWNGTAVDFRYDEAAKQWRRENTSKAVNDRSPLLKYDEYVRLSTGTDPQAALLECTGDDAEDFSHSIYGDKKAEYDREGISYSWWGHCNGWCAAALMEQEPVAPVEARGIRFEVADQKGLLSESFWGTQSDFTGSRYNLPPRNIRETVEPGRVLKSALESGSPRPVAEYISWYEKAWSTTMTAAARASARPEDFRDELDTYYSWYKRNYEDAFADVKPDVWHRILETTIGRRKLAFVADVTANEEVWNHPAFAYDSTITFSRDLPAENGQARKEWSVATTVWYATDGVSESILGISDFTKHYTYKLVTDAAGKVLRGEWTGSSVNDHPDFAWLPTHNPTGPDYGENYKLLYGKIQEILPVAHKASEARAIDVAVNGVRSSTRRGFDKTTTWSQPVDAAGEVRFTASAAAGRAVAKVKYFEQRVTTGSYPQATRDALAALGESTTGPEFAVSARLSANGKRMVVAYAYDASGRLLGIDEATVQYSTSGGSTGGSTGGGSQGDDAFEENDSQAAAKAVQAGSFANLACNDDDWFAITLAAQSDLTVKIDFSHAEGDLDMELRSASAQLGKSDGTTNTETVTKNGLAAGTYFARVYGYSGAKAKYGLTVTITPNQSTGGGSTGGSTGGNDDAFEPNNDRASAKAAPAGTTSNLRCNDDDWYSVTLAQAGSVTVDIAFRHAEGDLDLYLYNASGTELAKSDSTADSERVTKSGLAAGTYYVKVIGYNGARAAYSMTVATTQSGGSTGGSTGGTTNRTGTVTAASLNVRSGPGTTYPAVRTISRGTVVTILGESGSWWKVTFSGAPAGNLWVAKSYIRLN